MANRIKRSAALFKSSWAVLKTHRALLLLPVLSSVATLVVVASFVAPVVATVMLDDGLRNEITTQIANDARESDRAGSEPVAASTSDTAASGPDAASVGEDGGVSQGWEVAGLVYLFVFYVTTSFVVIFFNAALIAAANEHFKGNPSGLGVGLRLASRRLPQILGWALVAATVGTILRLISERSGLIGRIVIALVGMVWTIASYFAVPALVIEGVGPFKALKLSVTTLKETWGESLVLAAGFYVIGTLITLVSIVCIVVGSIMVAMGVTGDSTSTAANYSLEAIGILVGLAGIVALISWAILEGTLKGITQTALYRFAKTGDVPDGFDREHLEAAFQSRKSRKSFSMG
ncbi:MAG: hypothetical protein CMJ34_01125 [Phycisphaerae bacterium]|nr:hypothetical protein [Phycisphaerae bacterium]